MRVQPRPPEASEDTMNEVRRLAAERDHRLAPRMTGEITLTIPAAQNVIRHLTGRPFRPSALQRGADPRQVRHLGDPETGRTLCGHEQARPMTNPHALPRPYRVLIEQVPDGRYAVPSRTGNNDYDFFIVHTKRQGARKGQRFIDRHKGGIDSEVEISPMQGRYALEAILAEGIEVARDRYATEAQECWKCGIPLTDELSRALRIGPDCCKNVYKMTQAERAAALGLAIGN